MKASKRAGFTVALVLAVGIGGSTIGAGAASASTWQGPFDSIGTCLASSFMLGQVLTTIQGCEQHADRKFWYMTR